MRFKVLAAFLFTALLTSQPVWAEVYKIDKAHSSVNFKIKHLFSQVNGAFNDFDGTITYDPVAPETWAAEATIQTVSIDTNNEKRDKHLGTADFFDAEKYPKITFKSTKVEKISDSTAKMEGVLSMHGVEKPVTLDVQILGAGKDPWGNQKAGFSASGKIARKDFGITWNQTLETGGVLLGEDVEITLEVEADVKKEEPSV